MNRLPGTLALRPPWAASRSGRSRRDEGTPVARPRAMGRYVVLPSCQHERIDQVATTMVASRSSGERTVVGAPLASLLPITRPASMWPVVLLIRGVRPSRPSSRPTSRRAGRAPAGRSPASTWPCPNAAAVALECPRPSSGPDLDRQSLRRGRTARR